MRTDSGLDADHRDPMGQAVMELARDADSLLSRPPPSLVFAAPLCLDRPLLDFFEIGSPSTRGLAEHQAGDQPAREPEGGDEVDDVTAAEENADPEEPADDRDDRADADSRVAGIRYGEQGDADRDRAEAARIVQKVVGKRGDHRARQRRDGM